jgi:hypothetical protein
LSTDFVKRAGLEYESSRSYSDLGTVISTDQSLKPTQRGDFNTSFKRDKFFHLEFAALDANAKLVLDFDYKKTTLSSSKGPIEPVESLEQGFCSFLGATQGILFLVPLLLMPELMPTRKRITQLMDCKSVFLESESVVKIEGSLDDANFYEVWFETAAHTVQKCKHTITMSEELITLLKKAILKEQPNGLNVADSLPGTMFVVNEVKYQDVELK